MVETILEKGKQPAARKNLACCNPIKASCGKIILK